MTNKLDKEMVKLKILQQLTNPKSPLNRLLANPEIAKPYEGLSVFNCSEFFMDVLVKFNALDDKIKTIEFREYTEEEYEEMINLRFDLSGSDILNFVEERFTVNRDGIRLELDYQLLVQKEYNFEIIDDYRHYNSQHPIQAKRIDLMTDTGQLITQGGYKSLAEFYQYCNDAKKKYGDCYFKAYVTDDIMKEMHRLIENKGKIFDKVHRVLNNLLNQNTRTWHLVDILVELNSTFKNK